MWFNDFATIDLTYCNATKAKKKTALQNYMEFWDAFARLSNIGINRYKITGDFPETLDERTILQSLFWYGSFGLVNDKGVWLSLPAMPASDLTVYGYPRKINTFGRNGYNKTFEIIQFNGEEELVNRGISDVNLYDKRGFWVMEKKLIYPLARTCILMSERIADSMRSIDVMRNKMKDPYIVFTIEEMRRTVQEFFNNLKLNDELIISTGVFDPAKVQVEKLEFNPEILKAMKELIEWYEGRYNSFCGINSNPASDKKERLLVDEINANDEETDNNVNKEVEYMNAQLEKVNELTGWSIRMEVAYENKDIRRDSGDLSDERDISSDGDSSGPDDD